MDPPLDVAPEGEFACPAHKPGRRKTTNLMAPDMDVREGGMRHKPARVDVKFQVCWGSIVYATE